MSETNQEKKKDDLDLLWDRVYAEKRPEKARIKALDEKRKNLGKGLKLNKLLSAKASGKKIEISDVFDLLSIFS